MILLICRNCGKHLSTKELANDNIIDIDNCPCCGISLSEAERYILSPKNENLENISIKQLLLERMKNDDGKRYSLEEVKKMLLKEEPKYDLKKDTKLLLQVVELIKNECPNNDVGGLCNKPASNCLECWQQHLLNKQSI